MGEASVGTLCVVKQRLLVCVLVFIGAFFFETTSSGDVTAPKIPDPSDPPTNEVKVDSGYSPSVTSVAISYRTKRDPMTGVVTIVKGETANKTIYINWKKPAEVAAQPFEAILVSFQFTHKKQKGTYAITAANTPVKFDHDNSRYALDLEAFAQKFAKDINSTLPAAFDPNGTEFDFKDALQVVITPVGISDPIIAAPLKTGDPVTLGQKLTITFDLAIGDS